MKAFFSKIIVGAAVASSRQLAECNCVKVRSVSGVVEITFDDGDPVPVSAGDCFKTDWPLKFQRVNVICAAGASAVIIYGLGAISSESSSSAVGGGIQATSGDPEGVLDASSGQWAYDTSTGSLYLNPGTSGTTGWVNIIV